MQGLSKYQDFSKNKLCKLQKEMKQIDLLENRLKNLAVFVCGSYGRFEAHEISDLDPFFIDIEMSNSNGTSTADNQIHNTTRTFLDTYEIEFFAQFIRILKHLEFPPLTRDGEYLKIHKLQDIRSTLGGPKDDYENHFTARMLLLLESHSLYDNGAYDELVTQVINFYFKDYHDHERDFSAIFLLNDIVRYWKTMCLNYENKRELEHLSDIKDNEEKRDRKAKVHLKNLKLKFSRLMICYSMVIPLVAKKTHDPNDIAELVAMKPTERFSSLGTKSKQQYEKVLRLYMDFLDLVSQEDILNKIAKREFRNEQFELARQFRDEVYSLLRENADDSTWRYLII